MKPIRMVVRLVNNALRERREQLGMSQGEIAIAAGVPLGSYNALEAIRDKPVTKNGKWSSTALTISEFYNVEPRELFPEVVIAVEKNTIERKLDQEEVRSLMPESSYRFALGPEDALLSESKRLPEAIERALSTLTPTESSVLRRRFGFDDHEMTHRSIAEEDNLSRTRVQQIEKHALGKLRQPSRAKLIKEFRKD